MKCAVYDIVVNGASVASRFAPFMIKITVSLKPGHGTTTASIELDDSDGRVLFPQSGDPIQVFLGWEGSTPDLVFDGTIDEAHGRGSRGDGRKVEITAKGLDVKGKGKEHKRRHWDKKSVKEILTDAATAAGLSGMKVDAALGAIVRTYEAMHDESLIHFASRLAREIGGQFQVAGGIGILSRVGAGTSVSGQPLPTVTATWGVNCHEYDLAPSLSRPRHKATRARWYDRSKGKWNETTVELGDDGAEATATDRFTAPDEGEAKARADGASKRAKKNKGGGHVTIEGDTSAMPEGTCIVQVRPGLDGSYRIEEVEHTYDRGAGFTTKLELKQPEGNAGTDTRAKKATTSSTSPSGNQEAGAVPASNVG